MLGGDQQRRRLPLRLWAQSGERHDLGLPHRRCRQAQLVDAERAHRGHRELILRHRQRPQW